MDASARVVAGRGLRTGDVGDAAVVDHHEVLPIDVQLVRKSLHLLHSAKRKAKKR